MRHDTQSDLRSMLHTLIYKLVWVAATSSSMLIAGLRRCADGRHAPLRLKRAVSNLVRARAPEAARQVRLPYRAALDPQTFRRLIDRRYRSRLSTATASKATSAL
jgi:hypothetical protein